MTRKIHFDIVAHPDHIKVKLGCQGHWFMVKVTLVNEIFHPNFFTMTNLWYYYYHHGQACPIIKVIQKSRSYQGQGQVYIEARTFWISIAKHAVCLRPKCVLVCGVFFQQEIRMMLQCT